VSKPNYLIRFENAVLHFTGEVVPQKTELSLLCESLFDLVGDGKIDEKEIVYE